MSPTVDAFCADDGRAFSVRVDTEGQLRDAVAQALEFDGLAFIECTIDKDDCSKDLLEWGSRVAHANGRAYVEL